MLRNLKEKIDKNIYFVIATRALRILFTEQKIESSLREMISAKSCCCKRQISLTIADTLGY